MTLQMFDYENFGEDSDPDDLYCEDIPRAAVSNVWERAETPPEQPPPPRSPSPPLVMSEEYQRIVALQAVEDAEVDAYLERCDREIASRRASREMASPGPATQRQLVRGITPQKRTRPQFVSNLETVVEMRERTFRVAMSPVFEPDFQQRGLQKQIFFKNPLPVKLILQLVPEPDLLLRHFQLECKVSRALDFLSQRVTTGLADNAYKAMQRLRRDEMVNNREEYEFFAEALFVYANKKIMESISDGVQDLTDDERLTLFDPVFIDNIVLKNGALRQAHSEVVEFEFQTAGHRFDGPTRWTGKCSPFAFMVLLVLFCEKNPRGEDSMADV